MHVFKLKKKKKRNESVKEKYYVKNGISGN